MIADAEARSPSAAASEAVPPAAGLPGADLPETPPLSPHYYLDNFQRLCDTVEGQYGDLLRAEETAFLEQFAAAPRQARCLFVRLVSRRGPLFRRGQLNYPELDKLNDAVTAALNHGLLYREEQPPVEWLLALLRKPELVAIYGEHLPSTGLRKPELLAALNAELTEAELLARWHDWRGPEDWLLGVEHVEVVALFRLLFFGNSWQELNEFVVSDLGIIRYHPYRLDRKYRLFTSRDDIDEVLALDALKAVFKDAAVEDDLGTVLAVARSLNKPAADALDAPAAGAQSELLRDRLRNRVARQLERMQAPREAEVLYANCRQPPARERRARLLTAQGQYAEALAVCESIRDAPWSENEVDFAARQLPSLKRKLGEAATPRPRDRFEEDRLYLPRSLPVELAAAQHYGEHWDSVYYVENLLINASFGLAFWEQIFSPVPGAFVHPFQSAPLDMYSRAFHAKRRESVDRRLAELERGDLPAELLKTFDTHHGVSNAWVGWRGLQRELLERALAIIPREHWLAIWRRLLFDPEANRNGCPDLLALDEQQGYCLIEVKGPGDALQLHQRRWLRFFQAQGIPARVAWVEWQA